MLILVEQYDGDTVAASTSYTYDGVGNLLTMTAGGKTTTYTYNKYGGMLTEQDAMGQTVEYIYSSTGKPRYHVTRNKAVIYYGYDAMGRMLSTTAGNDHIYRSFTATGQVRTEESNWQKTTYTYYASGSQKSETDHTGKVTAYTYDDLGRLETEADGATVYTYAYDSSGNRTSLTVTGAEPYSVQYTYNANNRLIMEARTEGGSTYRTAYSYDANGNLTQKYAQARGTVASTNEILQYNSFDQLTGLTINSTSSAYAYNAQGIRTVAKTGNLRTVFLLDGGNVVGEIQNGGSIQSYLRGINLIRREAGTATDYYLFNAHGDVVNLVNNAGVVTQSYDYDAFGVEKDPDPLDTNHFRYCGEYLDAETGRYYLRARYYDPLIGRFTQRDTHWNTANMIYGDNPQKINEREDKLGLKTYSYAPQITAIMQAGNLYVYALNNPLAYCDPTGNSATLIIAAGIFLFGTLGGLTGMQLADAAGATGWEKALYVGVGTLIGGIGGYALATAAIPATVATAGVGASVSASAVAAGPVGSLGTTILGSWQAAEAYIRQTYDAVKHTFHNVPSGMSARIVDGYNESSGIIYEVKYGYAALSQFVQTEIQRDIHLIQNGVVKGVEWHFFISQVTGKGGPSTPLLDALLEAGIKVVFH